MCGIGIFVNANKLNNINVKKTLNQYVRITEEAQIIKGFGFKK